MVMRLKVHPLRAALYEHDEHLICNFFFAISSNTQVAEQQIIRAHAGMESSSRIYERAKIVLADSEIRKARFADSRHEK